MLEKQYIISRIEILSDGQVQVRKSLQILEDGVQIGSDTVHRHVVAPGDDLANEDVRVRAVCEVIHTPEVIAAYLEAHKPE